MFRFSSILFLPLYILSFAVFSNETPYIYISPNPSKVSVDLHSSNIDIVQLGENDVNFSITDTL